ncbi:Clarin-3 [Liparis tanakae]|uniref:Clarin-3 n=1 Tax=Liparis tanakae TaxID=230148 RepID=A0A4Z2I947_9TELE|nr:Clarin-3 [Liparis tanakae]
MREQLRLKNNFLKRGGDVNRAVSSMSCPHIVSLMVRSERTDCNKDRDLACPDFLARFSEHQQVALRQGKQDERQRKHSGAVAGRLDPCSVLAGTQPSHKLADIGGSPLVLHGLVVFLLVLCLLCSACSILISIYNSVSNPYETYMGPIGVYVCSSLSACLSVVVLIIFAVNVNSLAEDLVQSYAGSIVADVKNKTSVFYLGYFLVLLYTALSLIAVLLIYIYEHAAYTHRREQQRPTEDAPKEIMITSQPRNAFYLPSKELLYL